MGLITFIKIVFTAAWLPYASYGQIIDDLAPPPAARPPSLDPEIEQDRQLQIKRQKRQKKEQELTPKPQTPTEVRIENLKKETLKPHDHTLLMEISLMGVGVDTRGLKSGYTGEPTSHFNVFWRKKPDSERSSIWFGLRIAPFTGNGYYQGKPGDFAQTYFGPSISVGKTERPAEDAATDKPGIEFLSGWLFSIGISPVTQAGIGYGKLASEGRSDFKKRGVYFDPPGLWTEARYLKIMFGAIGINLVGGVQAGHEKTFIYGGVGAAGWN